MRGSKFGVMRGSMMEFFEPADIVIYIQGRGMVLKEKSFLAFDIISKK